MSDEGGSGGGYSSGGGKGGGGGGDFSGGGYAGAGNYANVGPQPAPGAPTVGDTYFQGSSTPLFNFASGTFDGNGGGSSDLSPTGLNTNGSSSASLGNPTGTTSSPSAGGVSASSVAGTPGVSAPTDLTANNPNDLFRTSNNAEAYPGAPTNSGSSSPTNTSSGTSLSSLTSKAGDQISKNPLGTALAAGGLGYQIFQGQQQSASTKTIADQAASLNAQGQQLASYLQSGSLPPGLRAQLDQATASAKARVIQNFANQGQSTDPTQNSALAQQLQSIDQAAIIGIAQIGQQLLQTGINESGMASDLYKKLSDIDATQTAAIGKAIASFASAANGGGGSSGIQLKLG